MHLNSVVQVRNSGWLGASDSGPQSLRHSDLERVRPEESGMLQPQEFCTRSRPFGRLFSELRQRQAE